MGNVFDLKSSPTSQQRCNAALTEIKQAFSYPNYTRMITTEQAKPGTENVLGRHNDIVNSFTTIQQVK